MRAEAKIIEKQKNNKKIVKTKKNFQKNKTIPLKTTTKKSSK